MYRITNELATHGLGEIEYPLSKDKLRTGEMLEGTEYVILDCRDRGIGNHSFWYCNFFSFTSKMLKQELLIVCLSMCKPMLF